jgi:hypothetical protein
MSSSSQLPTPNSRGAAAYVGGSFAPPLPAEKLAEYRVVIERDAPDDLKEPLLGLCHMVEAFYETPESQEPRDAHPVGMGFVQPLETAEIERLWDLVPWAWEVEALRGRCNQLEPTEVDRDNSRRHAEYKARGERMPDSERIVTLLDASRHLLWYAKELAEDREPCTCDKLS